ncbi:MAG TPA: S-layer homology domain-containing protein [Pseudoflavonifractor sp.]|nr:S-layer homology domain-containing protein [Pseudoflavonifractor sp.]
MKKRLLSGLVCAVLLLSLAAPAFAVETQVTQQEAAQVLAALDIMTGDENGNLHLEKNVTRAEFVKLTVAASAYADSVGPTASVSPYPDVAKGAWYASYVQVAKEKGVVQGNTKGIFEPDRNITLVEGVTMALRLLGYQDSDFSGAWGSGQMAMYRTLKLDRNIPAAQADTMTRQDSLWLFYNLLTAANKSGQTYLTTLGYGLTASGEIDRVALINSAMDGPVVAETLWQSSVPFDVNSAAVYRSGSASTLAAIQSTDVVYWSKSMRTLWAYTGKATGAIQALAPSATAPTAVTLGGQTYALETATAAYDLSDLGSFRTGDMVTLLLGRSGGVAAVRKPGQSAGTVYGIVTSTGTGSYLDADGKSYTAGTVTVSATDGGAYTYQWENKDKKFEAGDMVQVTLSSSGAELKKLSKAAITGKVSDAGDKLGSYALADGIEILDTYSDLTTGRVYPSRLAGVTLKDDMVRYYTLNTQGEVNRLILNDVTGDLHQYGILTDVTEVSAGMILMASYVYDVDGVTVPYTTEKYIWNLKEGPCQIKYDGQALDRIYNLTELKLTAVEGNKGTAGNRDYTLSDSVAVYELRDKTYYLTELARVTGGSYTLTGWYDKAEADGGRVRVIVAKAN